MGWTARRASEQAEHKHLEIDFEAGWSKAADQLNGLARAQYEAQQRKKEMVR